MKLNTQADYRKRRHLRVRKKVKGSADRPRMCVFLSERHIYVQFVDDVAGRTVAAASTLSKAMGKTGGKNTVAVAREVGKLAAGTAKEKGIAQVVFDRGGYAYKGRVKALADAAREGGLKF
jgi:large subunit ribosomal protein L18